MNKLLSGAIAATGLVVISACSDTFDPSSDGHQGRILPTVDLDKEVAAPKAKAQSRAGGEATEIGVADLTLKLTAASGLEYIFGIDEFPTNQDFPVGEYTFEAYYGQESDEGFEKPYYYGATSLTVLENKTTPVSVTASLANAMVTVQYTDAVKQYFASYEAEVASSTGAKFAYAPDETRAVYVSPGTININVAVTKQNGVSANLNPYSFTAEARHHYIVTFDVNGGETGAAQLIVTFSEELAEETVELDLSDQILTAPAPTVTPSGFTSGEALALIEGTTPEQPLRTTVVAQGGVKTVTIATTSASLIRQGWPEEVDLAAADAATLAKLSELGLDVKGCDGKSKMALVDFTNVASHIEWLEAADNTSTFTIVAKDNLMKSSDPEVLLTISIEKLALTISEIDPLYVDDTTLTFLLDYNGADAANEVKVQTRNERGTWSDAAATITPVSRAAATYKVTVPVAADGNVEFRVVAGDIISEVVTATREEPTHTLEITENNTFATYAMVGLNRVDGASASQDAATATLFVSTDGATFTETESTVNGELLKFGNLSPATTYYVKADVNGLRTRAVSFTTEAATQIPNGDMETWSSYEKSSGATKYSVWVAAEPWNTLNELTTSKISMWANYCAGSGTLDTDDAYSGSKAALIRTIGWERPTALNDPKNFTPGELYVGTYENSTANYGISFNTRPSALSFYYKYTAQNNGEQGYAEISVIDNANNVIATATKDLDAQSAYTKATVNLNYPIGSAKASSIRIIFRSTNTTQYLNKDGVVQESGSYVGSKLYVDDIALEY